MSFMAFLISWLRRGLTNLVGSQHLVRYGTGGRPPKAADHAGGGSQMVIFGNFWLVLIISSDQKDYQITFMVPIQSQSQENNHQGIS